MKFLSPEVVLDLYKSTIWFYIKYGYHAWAGASNCYLDMLDKLQKRVFMAASTTLAAALVTLAHLRSITRLSFFCRY